MTTARKIKILNYQIDKLHPSEALLNIFYDINWRTETLEYIRVFFGEDSEPYKRCKLYNDESDEEHKTKNYSTGSAKWVLTYTELLFSCVGILQHDLYKKSKFTQFLYSIGLTAWLSIMTFLILIAYYVGRREGIKTGKSLVVPEVVQPSNTVPQNHTEDSTSKQTKNSRTQTPIHKDSINN